MKIRHRPNHVELSNIDEYTPLRDVFIVTMAVYIFASIIMFTQARKNIWGRNGVCVAIVFMHAFTLARLTLKTLKIVWTRDQIEMDIFESQVNPLSQPVISFEMVKEYDSAFVDFMDHCKSRFRSAPFRWNTVTISPANAYDCWFKIYRYEREQHTDADATGERKTTVLAEHRAHTDHHPDDHAVDVATASARRRVGVTEIGVGLAHVGLVAIGIP